MGDVESRFRRGGVFIVKVVFYFFLVLIKLLISILII